VDVIVTGSDAAIRAAKQATDQIPIVMAGSVSDPVATGLVESFNRPGGNLTGSFVRLDELNGKRLELLREVLPKVSVVAVLSDKLGRTQFEQLKPVATALGLRLESIDVSDKYDFRAEFARVHAKHAGAVILLGSPAFYVRRAGIGAIAIKS